MGKFREHTVKEKRKLRSSRQKRKRHQWAAAQKETLKRALIMREIELTKDRQDLSLARVYCRKWKEKCVENRNLRQLLSKNRQMVSSGQLFLIIVINLSEVNKESMQQRGTQRHSNVEKVELY